MVRSRFGLLRRPFGDEVLGRMARATNSLFICAPYFNDGLLNTGAGHRLTERLPQLALTVLCNLSLENVASGATQPEAIVQLADAAKSVRLHHLSSLHAKIYVADRDYAFVTSANFTAAGFYRNVEYGVAVEHRRHVSRVLSDLRAYADLGAVVSASVLQRIASLAGELRRGGLPRRKAIQVLLPLGLRRQWQSIEDDVIRSKLRGQNVHATFARTILFVLRHGPMKTADIHERVREIHPELCDDAVDRVIDGRHFGKRWKHAVRTAQARLKRQGRIELHQGQWRLSPPQ